VFLQASCGGEINLKLLHAKVSLLLGLSSAEKFSFESVPQN
jgi:hypothetical protein